MLHSADGCAYLIDAFRFRIIVLKPLLQTGLMVLLMVVGQKTIGCKYVSAHCTSEFIILGKQLNMMFPSLGAHLIIFTAKCNS